MRILLLCGSQRAASLNSRLLDEVARLIPPGIATDFLGRVTMPLFDQDIEHDPAVLGELATLHGRFHSADAIILASPEYNGMMTPYLKNIIDWVSRLPRIDATAINVFQDKPILLCTATAGSSGGALGLVALRALFGYVGAIPFADAICLPHAGVVWDAAGHATTVLPIATWADCVTRFCSAIPQPALGEAA